MQPLKPTLWRTCRVIANGTRLNLLRALYSCEELPVSRLAEETGTSVSLASGQLRALNARGLISARSAGRWVFYRAVPNPAVEHAEVIGNAIRGCCALAAENRDLIEAATAFTHLRRIVIAKNLWEGEKSVLELTMTTHISTMALHRHLAKLVTRRMVEQVNSRYRLTWPENALGQILLTIARNRA